MQLISKPSHLSRFVVLILTFLVGLFGDQSLAARPGTSKEIINSLYIPLADHYAAIVAYERYRKKMVHADFRIQQMKNWDLLRAYFQSGEVDMAYVMSPLAMDMFREKPQFRWIGLMHRDGNALAINDKLNQEVRLPSNRVDRKPNAKVANALKNAAHKTNKPVEIGIPHLLSTHAVVLFSYLEQYSTHLTLSPRTPGDVLAIAVAPPKSPAFIRGKSNRAEAAAFEQSLPWADVVETGGFGHVAWYSRDVIPWKDGHVECIAIANDKTISEKHEALGEVMSYIHKAGEDIERARSIGGELLNDIVRIIQKHIPTHSSKAIIASLDPELRVINYQNLNVDKEGLKLIMNLAVEGGILKAPIDIDAFSDTQFSLREGNHID